MTTFAWIILIILLAALAGALKATVNQTVTIGGKTITGNVTRTGASDVASRVALPAGNAGTLSVRTDNTTGTLTLGATHTIVTGDIIDLYWGAGATAGIRRGMTVGVVAGTSVPIGGAGALGGVGDNLPIATTPIVASKVVTLNIDFDGDDAILVAAQGQRRNSIAFQQDDGTAILNLDLGKSSGTAGGAEGESWIWHTYSVIANPFLGVDVGKVVVSNGSSAGTAQVTVGAVLDNDV